MKVFRQIPVLFLLTSLAVLPMAAYAGSGPQRTSQNIAQIAKGEGSFKTLTAALEATGLDKVLSAPGPFTVFAPTDEAFAKLPPGTVDALLKDIPRLKSILLFHVVAGEVRAADVAKVTSAKTVEGSSLPVKVSGGSVRVGGASVVKTDIEASNGVIHVIDTVLIPGQ